jgi:peptide/nickel transport system ATP-binding protein
MFKSLLELENVKTWFYTETGVVKAVDGVSLDVKEKETLGIVGESGSGKTVTALSILGIVPRPGKILEGKILYKGINLIEKSEEEMQKIRGKEIALVFQDPTTSFNPLYTIASQLTEIIQRHQSLSTKEAAEKAIRLLELVGISDPRRRFKQYPHELSTGMRQRVAIARALLCDPRLLIADEPTTALDVTIQAQILELLKDLKKTLGMSMMLITHDMGAIAEMSDRVTVMYAGRVCETADSKTIFKKPKHPYTEALLTAVPRIDVKKGTLQVIPGDIPDMINPPPGCRFHPRCKYSTLACKEEIPKLKEVGLGHRVACLHAHEIEIRVGE